MKVMNPNLAKSPGRLGVLRSALLTFLILPSSCSSDHPVVSGVSPSSGSARGGQTAVISGAHFENGASVNFGSASATSVKFLSENELQVTTPLSLAGTVGVSVRNPSGDEGSLEGAFSYERLKLAFIEAPSAFLPDFSDLPVTDAATADFDGDGDIDILLAVRGKASRLLLNEGNGSFAFSDTTYENEDAGSEDASSDAPDGAKPDSSLGDAASEKETGTPDASDAQVPPSSSGLWQADTLRVVAADFDLDTSPDLVACNDSGQGLKIWLNDKTGHFTESKAPLPAFDCIDALAVDFDKDGRLDIAILAYESFGTSLRLLMNRKTTSGIAWEELKGPKAPETPGAPDAGSPTPDAGTEDTDGGTADGGKDSGSTDSGLPISNPVLHWNERMSRITAGDVDGDGTPDLVISSSDQKALQRVRFVGVALDKTGVLSFAELNSLLSFPDPIGATGLLDVEGDGDLDLVAVAGPGQDRLLLNDGKGRFFDDTTASMPVDNSTGRNVALADMDLDGKLDLVISNFGGVNRLYVHGEGTRLQDETPSLPLEIGQTTSMIPVDVDRDGDLDLLVISDKAPVVRLFVSTESK